MEKGIEIFKAVTVAKDPIRAVSTLSSTDLAALILELKKKRWCKSYVASYTLDECMDVAVSRFLTEVELNY